MCKVINTKEANKFSKKTIQLVDEGLWSLWTVKPSNTHVVYVLNTGKKFYFFDKQGNIVSTSSKLGNYKKDDIARFSEWNILKCV